MKTDQYQAIKQPRIALYGGAFDPVHRAHLAVACAARDQASLKEVVFIPAAQSPLKGHAPLASDADRVEMLKRALAEEEGFVIDDSELRRGGVSYTVETVRKFKQRESAAELCWIIGSDQLEQLDRWHAVAELVQLVKFLVVARPGHVAAAPPIPGLDWMRIEAPLMEWSSSMVRERIAQGACCDAILPEAVQAFIREQGLYV